MSQSKPALTWTAREGGGAVKIGQERLLDLAFQSGNGVPFRAVLTGDVLDLSAVLPGTGSGPGAIAAIRHFMDKPEHIWLPHVSPYDDTVIGDHSLRSPALLFADDRRVLALIPEVDDLIAAQNAGYRIWLDYDHAKREIRVAAGAYKTGRFHVAYQPMSLDYRGQKPRLRLRILSSTSEDDLQNPYRLVAECLWKSDGRDGLAEGGSQRAPFSKYCEYVAQWAFAPEPKGWGDTVWQEFAIGGKKCGAPAFIVDVAQHPGVPIDQRRWREQRSVWNQAWFSTQRTANGLLRYARQTKSADLERRARMMTAVALAAPQTDGLFPSVYTAGGGGYQLYKDTPGWEKGRWTNSDRRPPGVSANAVHILDAAFTCRLLLEWHDLNPGESECLEYVRRFADRLIRLQRPNGSFPGWIEPNGEQPHPLTQGPESAMGASLLLELARRFPDENIYGRAGLLALEYLEHGPVKESRWEDFETYYSCSRWGSDRVGKKIERNGVYKSNTFSPFWCAEAFLEGFRVSGDQRYLALGARCLDELSLYQQVWQPPSIPAPTHGGFGVMNADGEWNDARQSLFAPLYMAYFGATGKPEYFERGVSALRASFAMMYCPENTEVKGAYEKQHPFFGPESYGFMMENIAHGGPGPSPIGPFTIFTWGNGAALEAAAKVRDIYGDVYVDVARKAAFGIDGCNAEFRDGRVIVRDRYARASLAVRLSTGKEMTLRLTNGEGSLAIP